jgi:hypothetical protein
MKLPNNFFEFINFQIIYTLGLPLPIFTVELLVQNQRGFLKKITVQ